MLEERKEKVNPFEGRELDELNDEIDVCSFSMEVMFRKSFSMTRTSLF